MKRKRERGKKKTFGGKIFKGVKGNGPKLKEREGKREREGQRERKRERGGK